MNFNERTRDENTFIISLLLVSTIQSPSDNMSKKAASKLYCILKITENSTKQIVNTEVKYNVLSQYRMS